MIASDFTISCGPRICSGGDPQNVPHDWSWIMFWQWPTEHTTRHSCFRSKFTCVPGPYGFLFLSGNINGPVWQSLFTLVHDVKYLFLDWLECKSCVAAVTLFIVGTLYWHVLDDLTFLLTRIIVIQYCEELHSNIHYQLIRSIFLFFICARILTISTFLLQFSWVTGGILFTLGPCFYII